MAGAAFYGLLQSPVLGTSFYNVMASERSIRDYARRTLFYDYRRVTDRLIAHLYATSHQAGAQHAIAAFLASLLHGCRAQHLVGRRRAGAFGRVALQGHLGPGRVRS